MKFDLVIVDVEGYDQVKGQSGHTQIPQTVGGVQGETD